MSKTKKILLILGVLVIAILIKNNGVNAAEYIWPIDASNAGETYIEYEYYGSRYYEPIKDGKYGREYIVNNTKWPNEQYYYNWCESHYGVDITGINGNVYKVVSVVNGKVIATSGTSAYNPGTNFIDRNQRRTSGGLYDGGGYGNYVIIQEDSTGRCFIYGHLKGGTIKVSKGDTVTPGQEIATMGSSGDSGHMHLHFEMRTSKSATIGEYYSGAHYLVNNTTTSNLDPVDYIGTTPIVRQPVEDKKTVRLSHEDAKIYVRYLYRTVLLRNASEYEANIWADKYIETGSIGNITVGIFLSREANYRRGEVSNLDLSKQAYEIILSRGKDYTEQEMQGHVNKMNNGIWEREDFIYYVCNSYEFTRARIDQIINSEKNRIGRVYGIASPENLTTKGDLNGDGRINAKDASICLQLRNRFLTVDPDTDRYAYAVQYADMNDDGKIDTRDAAMILSWYARNSVN